MPKTVERADKKLYWGCTPAERERIHRMLGEVQTSATNLETYLHGPEFPSGPEVPEHIARATHERKQRFESSLFVVQQAGIMFFACSGCGRPPALGCKCIGPDGQPLDWN